MSISRFFDHISVRFCEQSTNDGQNFNWSSGRNKPVQEDAGLHCHLVVSAWNPKHPN